MIQERFCLRGGDVVSKHELLREIFAAFELGAGLTGSNHQDVFQSRVAFEIVANTFHQRYFGTNDDEVDLFIDTQLTKFLKVIDRNGNVGSDGCRTGIARSNEEVGTEGALTNFETQCVLSTAGTDYKNIHRGRK